MNIGMGPDVQDLVRLFQKSPQGVQLLLRRIGLVSILMEQLAESDGDLRRRGRPCAFQECGRKRTCGARKNAEDIEWKICNKKLPLRQ